MTADKYRNILKEFRRGNIRGGEISPLSKTEILGIGEKMLPGDRAFLYDLFLSGARVSELLPSMKAERKLVEEKGEEFYKLDLLNLKNRRTPRKTVIGYMADDRERQMIEHIVSWMTRFDKLEYPYLQLYPQEQPRHAVKHLYARQEVEVFIATKEGIKPFYISLFPHLIRHSRASNLVHQYHYDALSLMHFMGWSDPRPAATYVSANIDSFTSKAGYADGGKWKI